MHRNKYAANLTLITDYSSILLHAGSKSGHLSTLKLLPAAGGRYSVALAGSVSLDDQVISISPINVETGDRASASQPAVANLRSGIKVHGAVVAVTRSGARMFKPPVSRGGHKTWDDFMCDAATVVRFEDRATALVGLFGNGTARAYSIPGLKEIGVAKAAAYLDVRKFPAASVGLSGHVLGWVGPSELGLINVWGTGKRIDEARDTLFNSELTVPARPTISNLQWVSGQQYMTPQELYLLGTSSDANCLSV